MKRFHLFVLSVSILAAAAFAIRALADDPPDGPPPPDANGPGGPDGPGEGRGPGGPGGPGGGFHLLPRFVAEKLKLTADQQEQIVKLEKETKAKLDKILTPAQKKILEQARPPRPEGGPDQGGRDQGGRDQGGPGQGRGQRGAGGARPDRDAGPDGPGDEGQAPPPRRPAGDF